MGLDLYIKTCKATNLTQKLKVLGLGQQHISTNLC